MSSLRFAKGLTETPLAEEFHEMGSQFMEYMLDTYASRCVVSSPRYLEFLVEANEGVS